MQSANSFYYLIFMLYEMLNMFVEQGNHCIELSGVTTRSFLSSISMVHVSEIVFCKCS